MTNQIEKTPEWVEHALIGGMFLTGVVTGFASHGFLEKHFSCAIGITIITLGVMIFTVFKLIKS